MAVPAFVHNLYQLQNKLSSRSIKCVFLGYSGYQKGYRCYNTTLKRFFISADVTFFEDQPYYCNIHDQTALQNVDPVPLPLPDVPLHHDSSPNRFSNPPLVYVKRTKALPTTTSVPPSTTVTSGILPTTLPSFTRSLIVISVPKNYEEARTHPGWLAAMNEEMAALYSNAIWILTALPPVGCRWIYTIKYKSDGSVDRLKAQLVAKGFTQTEGVDFPCYKIKFCEDSIISSC